MKKPAHFPKVRPAVDIVDVSDGIVILANIPGVSSDDLRLLLQGDELHIHGSSRCPRPETGGRDLRNLEFGNVEFELDIVMDAPLSALPETKLEQGVLSVFLPGESRKDIHFL